MGKFIKSNILSFLIGFLISGTVVYAVTVINANQVAYSSGTVNDALDELYDKVDEVKAIKKFCQLKSGEAETIGAEYECDPGDGVKRIFYVLTVRNNEIDLILDRNVNEGTTSWNDAMEYFRSGAGVSTKNSWTNVMNIDLPKAQAIADAVGNTNWIAANSEGLLWCFGSKKQDLSDSPYCTNSNQGTYAWLFNHLIDCAQTGCTDDSDATALGYWSRDLVYNTIYAWGVNRGGFLNNGTTSNAAAYGIRPVITVLKSNLYE